MKIRDLDKLADTVREQVAQAIELPEPAMRLDMSSREGNSERQFKYLHQMCTLHSEHFAQAHKVKCTLLTDGYRTVAEAENPLGPYLFARAIFELSAFTHDVSRRLREIMHKPEANWRSNGEEFFSLVVRARFATSDPSKRQALEEAGAPAKLLKPINITESIRTLLATEEGASLHGEYDKLCDFVHHNLSSQLVSSAGVRIGDSAYAAGGGSVRMLKPAPITRYEYPLATKAAQAIAETLPTVLKCTEIFVQSINQMPLTPFTEHQLRTRIGSPIGFRTLSQ